MADDYARGGYIPGDPVPMPRLHTDFVITAEQAKRLGTALLEQLNASHNDEPDKQ